MHLGFIGLGNLGRAVCGRLLACGHELTVWNRTPAKAEGMTATWASSPASLAGQAQVIFLCLFDSHAVRQTLTAPEGLLAGEVTGKTIIDLTTNHFRDVSEFHDLCAAAGAVYLETPVLGSVIPAAQGALTVLISGSQEGFTQVRPILNDIGKQLFYLGPPTMATKMKLINNLALGSFMATLAEALALGEKSGIDREDILEILSVGGGNSLVLSAKKSKLLTGDFTPHFSCALMYKDLHCLQDLAYGQKKALFTAAVAKELFALACEKGLAHDDFSAVYTLLKAS